MQSVLVLNCNRVPLMPCHPARARELLHQGKAAVFRRYPFVIILKDRGGVATQTLELKMDPGSKTTGVALVVGGASGKTLRWAGEIVHRGQAVRDALFARRQLRRGRRFRTTRYRSPRFENRRKQKGWLPPSLRSRVENCLTWAKRLQRYAAISAITVETARFDTQIMQHPEITGVEYQQGTLAGYELREYLLEKFNRQCAYCGRKNISLQVEHVQAKARGGSNRVSNLVLSCRECNEAKGTVDIREFLKAKPSVLRKVLGQLKTSLKDAAAVNATRYAIGDALKSMGMPISFWSGGRTKFNRIAQGYPKTHWLDAACVGETGANVQVPALMSPLVVVATGRGSRQMCRMDKYGFPRTSAKALKTVHGFKTGDLVRAVVVKGKKAGTHVGRVAIRASGSFNIKSSTGTVQGIPWKYCSKLHLADGYNYFGGSVSSST